jgi:hypothetical protein
VDLLPHNLGHGIRIPERKEGSSIQVCRVKSPTLEDIPPMNDSIGVVAFANAYEIVNAVLRQRDIDRKSIIIIGVRDR